MFPAKSWYDVIATNVADGILSAGGPLGIVPILADFLPNLGLVKADLTLGAGSLAVIDADDVVAPFVDPLTGAWIILPPPPAGGFRWVFDGATPAASATVYGFAMLDNDHNALFATERLVTPIPLTSAGQLLGPYEPKVTQLVPPYQ